MLRSPRQCNPSANGRARCRPAGTVLGTLSTSTVAQIARLHDVSAAAGGLLLTDNRIVLPTSSSSQLQPPTSVSVDGTDISHPHLGPLSNGKLANGRTFTAADANADVAVVDANYATANKLKVGSTVTVAKTKFTVIGIVTQPQASSPPEVYIPLARAQALATNPGDRQVHEKHGEHGVRDRGQRRRHRRGAGRRSSTCCRRRPSPAPRTWPARSPGRRRAPPSWPARSGNGSRSWC